MSTTRIEYRPFTGEAVLVEVDTLPLDCFECIDCGEYLPVRRAAQVVPAPVDICLDCLDERMGEYDWPPRFPTRMVA